MATTVDNPIVLFSSSPLQAASHDLRRHEHEGPMTCSHELALSIPSSPLQAAIPQYHAAIHNGHEPSPRAAERSEISAARPKKRRKTDEMTSAHGLITETSSHFAASGGREIGTGHNGVAVETVQMPKPAGKAAAVPEATTTVETSHHFTTKHGDSGPPTEAECPPTICDDPSVVDLGRVVAPMRRRSWTPTCDDSPPSNQNVGQDEQPDTEGSLSFRNIVNSFEYREEQSANGKNVAKPKAAATRKTKVGMTDGALPKRKTAAERKASAAKKQKEPKPPKLPKAVRAKTVTDFAISAYRKVDLDGPQSELPVTAFFQPAGTQAVELNNDPSCILEPTTAKSKKSSKVNAVLHFNFPQPEQAMNKMRDQDFLFGTSSQLAKPESPTTYRLVQQAIVESERMALMSPTRSDDQERSPTTSRLRVAHAPHGTSLSVGPGEGNLWSVASRDANLTMFVSSQRRLYGNTARGRLVSPTPSVKVGAAVGSVDAEHCDPSKQLVDVNDQRKANAEDDRHDSGFLDLSEVEQAHRLEKEADVGVGTDVEPVLITSSPANPRPALQNMDINAPIDRPIAESTGLKLLPTAPLQSPAKAKPKAPKATKAKPKSKATEEAPKRPRGRPRKDSTTAAAAPKPKPTKRKPATPKRSKPEPSSWHDIEEISDSEPAASPPSPARRSSPSQKPGKLTLSGPVDEVDPGDEESLFKAITAAVKGAPRGDAKNPSWHEKILLYDPIVLEDLSEWLGGRGISVKPAAVQRWCERHSICCLWKEGLRGGVRARY